MNSTAPSSPGRDRMRTPLVIVVDDQEWTARSLESILSPAGFAVLKAYTGRQAMELMQRVKPDVLFVDMDLPDVDGRDLCRSLVASESISSGTPILALCTARPPREQRLDILRSGAWDIVSLPLDPEELVLKLEALVRAKQEADRASDRSLLDASTGFYNVKGLMRRLDELTAEARRYTRPLSCVVVGPRDDAQTQSILNEILALDPLAGQIPPDEQADPASAVASSLNYVTRTSDAKGLLGDQHYVVVAPDTDLEGARRLAERILEGYGPQTSADSPLCIGLYSLENNEDPVRPGDLLTRATTAFRRAQHQSSTDNRIEFFRDN